MLVFNQQANIKNVNGAIADIFANRPAPQSTFYLFYSTDTQEIYYDNGAWILIGSGGGSGVNIYNANGTLTGNRTLNGANNLLNFSNLTGFSAIFNDSGTIRKENFPLFCGIDFSGSGGQYFTRIYYRDFNNPNDTDFYLYKDLIKTQYNANDIGLKLDFANKSYTLGDPGNFNNASTFAIDDNNRLICTRFNTGNEGIEISQTTYLAKFGWLNSVNSNHIEFDQTNNVTSTYIGNNRLGLEFDYNTNIFKIGDVNSVANNNYLEIDDTSQLINLGKPGQVQLVIDNSVTQLFKTLFNGNDIGLKLDFANTIYTLGDATHKLILDGSNGEIYLATTNYVELYCTNSLNYPSFLIDDINGIIKTKYQNNDTGLKLDFANQTHFIGDPLNGVLNINSGAGILEFIWLINTKLLSVDVNLGTISFGDLNNIITGTQLITDYQNYIIKTQNNSSDIGLKLDFANNIYYFGDYNNIIGISQYYIGNFANNCGLLMDEQSDVSIRTPGVLYIDTPSNGSQYYQSQSTIKTTYSTNDIGLKLDFANSVYQLGQLTGANESIFIVDDSNELIYTTFGGNSNGIAIDLASNSFIFGRITGSNTTNLTINDGATYPVEINGTNVLSGTSGGNSGQHLKIKINGTDYKIKLENP